MVSAFGGAALAVQGRINGQLGDRLHDGVAAALVSTASGFLLLCAATVFPVHRQALGMLWRTVRTAAPSAGDGRRLRWWHCLGGMCGAFLVTTQGLTVTALGIAIFTVAVVASQVVSSLVVDRFGVGPAGVRPLTPWRLLGATLAMAAVLAAMWGQLGQGVGLGPAVLPALAGMGTAWQQAVNGRVGGAAGSAYVATLVNFATGTAALALVYAAQTGLGRPTVAPTPQWWLYTGGPIGIVVVTTVTVAVHMVGVLLVGLASVAGQLLAALLLDLMLPTAGHAVGGTTVLGTTLILAALLVAARPGAGRPGAG
ncbi:MAG: DMT family transporter, partial [Kutzneria sp.]|nr:DMT family transporter [Kutzneria sp.]